MRTIFCVLLLCLLTACSVFGTGTQAVLTADDVLAQLLCAEAQASKRSISLEDARDTYCSEREQWRPWVEVAAELRAAEDYERAVQR